MSERFSHQLVRASVASICQSVGFGLIQTTAWDALTDVLFTYIREVGHQCRRESELASRCEANLLDLQRVLGDQGIQIKEMENYLYEITTGSTGFTMPVQPACPSSYPILKGCPVYRHHVDTTEESTMIEDTPLDSKEGETDQTDVHVKGEIEIKNEDEGVVNENENGNGNDSSNVTDVTGVAEAVLKTDDSCNSIITVKEEKEDNNEGSPGVDESESDLAVKNSPITNESISKDDEGVAVMVADEVKDEYLVDKQGEMPGDGVSTPSDTNMVINTDINTIQSHAMPLDTTQSEIAQTDTTQSQAIAIDNGQQEVAQTDIIAEKTAPEVVIAAESQTIMSNNVNVNEVEGDNVNIINTNKIDGQVQVQVQAALLQEQNPTENILPPSNVQSQSQLQPETQTQVQAKEQLDNSGEGVVGDQYPGGIEVRGDKVDKIEEGTEKARIVEEDEQDEQSGKVVEADLDGDSSAEDDEEGDGDTEENEIFWWKQHTIAVIGEVILPHLPPFPVIRAPEPPAQIESVPTPKPKEKEDIPEEEDVEDDEQDYTKVPLSDEEEGLDEEKWDGPEGSSISLRRGLASSGSEGEGEGEGDGEGEAIESGGDEMEQLSEMSSDAEMGESETELQQQAIGGGRRSRREAESNKTDREEDSEEGGTEAEIGDGPKEDRNKRSKEEEMAEKIRLKKEKKRLKMSKLERRARKNGIPGGSYDGETSSKRPKLEPSLSNSNIKVEVREESNLSRAELKKLKQERSNERKEEKRLKKELEKQKRKERKLREKEERDKKNAFGKTQAVSPFNEREAADAAAAAAAAGMLDDDDLFGDNEDDSLDQSRANRDMPHADVRDTLTHTDSVTGVHIDVNDNIGVSSKRSTGNGIVIKSEYVAMENDDVQSGQGEIEVKNELNDMGGLVNENWATGTGNDIDREKEKEKERDREKERGRSKPKKDKGKSRDRDREKDRERKAKKEKREQARLSSHSPVDTVVPVSTPITLTVKSPEQDYHYDNDVYNATQEEVIEDVGEEPEEIDTMVDVDLPMEVSVPVVEKTQEMIDEAKRQRRQIENEKRREKRAESKRKKELKKERDKIRRHQLQEERAAAKIIEEAANAVAAAATIVEPPSLPVEHKTIIVLSTHNKAGSPPPHNADEVVEEAVPSPVVPTPTPVKAKGTRQRLDEEEKRRRKRERDRNRKREIRAQEKLEKQALKMGLAAGAVSSDPVEVNEREHEVDNVNVEGEEEASHPVILSHTGKGRAKVTVRGGGRVAKTKQDAISAQSSSTSSTLLSLRTSAAGKTIPNYKETSDASDDDGTLADLKNKTVEVDESIPMEHLQVEETSRDRKKSKKEKKDRGEKRKLQDKDRERDKESSRKRSRNGSQEYESASREITPSLKIKMPVAPLAGNDRHSSRICSACQMDKDDLIGQCYMCKQWWHNQCAPNANSQDPAKRHRHWYCSKSCKARKKELKAAKKAMASGGGGGGGEEDSGNDAIEWED